jgi:hypothetical protein
MDAVSLLHRVEDGSAPMLGRPRSRTPATASW